MIRPHIIADQMYRLRNGSCPMEVTWSNSRRCIATIRYRTV